MGNSTTKQIIILTTAVFIGVSLANLVSYAVKKYMPA